MLKTDRVTASQTCPQTNRQTDRTDQHTGKFCKNSPVTNGDDQHTGENSPVIRHNIKWPHVLSDGGPWR